MPELPEVETVARGLHRYVTGGTVARATCRRADIMRRGSLRLRRLEGGTVAGVERIGKNIAVRFDSRLTLVVNLGMTGRLLYSETGRFPREYAGRHLHMLLHFTAGGEMRYHDPRRFGSLLVTDREEIASLLGLGKDPFQMSPREFHALLRGRRAPVKSILLNQKLISGMGNIYIDEALFRAGIDPAAPANAAAGRSGELLQAARAILRRAIRAGGTTVRDFRNAEGANGYFQRELVVYGRAGEPCIRCGSPLVRTVVAGRGTHFCPSCQPPAARDG